MRKSICAFLARCFNAHLTEEEEEFKIAVQNVRTKANELNTALDELKKFNPGGWVNYGDGYSRPQFIPVKSFRITSVEASLNRSLHV